MIEIDAEQQFFIGLTFTAAIPNPPGMYSLIGSCFYSLLLRLYFLKIIDYRLYPISLHTIDTCCRMKKAEFYRSIVYPTKKNILPQKVTRFW